MIVTLLRQRRAGAGRGGMYSPQRLSHPNAWRMPRTLPVCCTTNAWIAQHLNHAYVYICAEAALPRS
jgi:hypothetical protein